VRSTVSVGMPMPQRILGGLNVHRFDEQVMDPDSVQLLQVFAGYAAIGVADHVVVSGHPPRGRLLEAL